MRRSFSPVTRSRTSAEVRRWLALGLVLVLLWVGGVLWLRSSSDRPAGAASVPADYPFGVDSVWRSEVTSGDLDPRSGAMVTGLTRQVDDVYGGIAAFNVTRYNVSFVTVDADQPPVDVQWDNCQKKDYTPEGLLGEGGQFSDVPVPEDAVPAGGTDGQLTIYSPSQDAVWEFWRMERTGSTWSACWGGRLDDVSTSVGYFEDGFGASATGMAVSGGMVWLDDAERGEIDHALALAIPDPAVWTRYRWPAQRSDGGDKSPDSIPEGTRLRLDPTVDVSSLRLHPLAAMVAEAAQRYGFIVTDKAGAVSVIAEAPPAQEERAWQPYLDGTEDYLVMRGFPWDRMQVMAPTRDGGGDD